MIYRIANAVSSLEGLSVLLTVIGRLGYLVYVTVSWAIYFARSAQFFAVGAIAVGALALSAAATARIPIGLVVLSGGAAAIGTAFWWGQAMSRCLNLLIDADTSQTISGLSRPSVGRCA